MPSHLLTTEEREGVLLEKIFPYADERLRPRENPKSIILGGQPGAGKSNFIKILKDNYPGIIAINGDDFRKYHPYFEKLMEKDSENATNLTQDDCNYWVEKLIEYVSDRKGDIIIEGTMRRPEVVLNTARLLKGKNYDVETIAITAPPELSFASMFYRFEVQKSQGGTGRFVKPEGHEAAFSGVGPSLSKIFESSDVDRISLYSRRGPEYSKEYENKREGGNWINPENPREIFSKLVSQELSGSELKYIIGLYDQMLEMAESREAEKEYINFLKEKRLPLQQKLENQAELRKNFLR